MSTFGVLAWFVALAAWLTMLVAGVFGISLAYRDAVIVWSGVLFLLVFVSAVTQLFQK